MENKTQAKKETCWDMDEILEQIAKRYSTAPCKAATAARASERRDEVGVYEDYYSQSQNLPSCYEPEFYPAPRR